MHTEIIKFLHVRKRKCNRAVKRRKSCTQVIIPLSPLPPPAPNAPPKSMLSLWTLALANWFQDFGGYCILVRDTSLVGVISNIEVSKGVNNFNPLSQVRGGGVVATPPPFRIFLCTVFAKIAIRSIYPPSVQISMYL